VTESQAKPLPQLLLVAEPLLREGLLRLLGEGQAPSDVGRFPGGPASYRLACCDGDLESRPDLVIWAPGQSLPAPTLAR